MNKYDVIILGGGPAGYYAALELDKNSKKVLLIEKAKLGGTCLHKGCIPTKSLLYSAKKYSYCKEFVKRFDIVKANTKMDNDIKKLYAGLKNKFERSNVDILYSYGTIKKKGHNFFVVEAGNQEYVTDSLIVATGSHNRNEFDIPGLSKTVSQGYAVYSEQFFSLSELGKHILIIGAGVIGIELASYLGEIGKEVTILEREDEMLSNIVDGDVRKKLEQGLRKKDITVITKCDILDVDGTCITYKKEEKLNEIKGDLIIIAGGREANLKNIGIEDVGICVKDGFLLVDEHCETNVKGIYACGDVIGKNMLAHEAYKEAEIVTSNICGTKITMEYRAIPKVIYCNPEVAVVGYSEEKCVKEGIYHTVVKCSMNYSSRYLIENEDQIGICKMIFDSNDILIGAQLLGNGCSELIFVLADMVNQKLGKNQIKDKIYPHPSIVEVIKECVKN